MPQQGKGAFYTLKYKNELFKLGRKKENENSVHVTQC